MQDKQENAHFRCAEMQKWFGIEAEQDKDVLKRKNQDDF